MTQAINNILTYGTLNFLFCASLLVGITYAVILLGLGHIGNSNGDGGHADGDHSDAGDHAAHSSHIVPGLHINLATPIGIATFLTGIGSSGLICINGFKISPVWCVICSGVGGIFFNVLVTYAIYKIFVASEATSITKTKELQGVEAEVITPISVDGVGQIAYTTKQGRQTALARSSTKEEMGRGETVVIVKFVGTTAIVRRQISETEKA